MTPFHAGNKMMTDKEYAAYRNGFSNGINLNKNYPTTLMVLGKSFDEICELIRKDEESKMVRLVRKSEIEQLFPNELQQKTFLDMFSHIIAIDPVDKAIVINVTDDKPVIVKRNGKQVYSDFE